jgi:hypothetical protein
MGPGLQRVVAERLSRRPVESGPARPLLYPEYRPDADAEARRHLAWLRPSNHLYRRISRITRIFRMDSRSVAILAPR